MSGLRADLAIIAGEVAKGARVLDVGCGDGALMAALRDQKQVDARGMEIDRDNVAACVARGLSVIQGNADTDLADYPDMAFDYAVLSQTLQTTMRPDLVVEQLLRIGARAFVSFPNFAQWRTRIAPTATTCPAPTHRASRAGRASRCAWASSRAICARTPSASSCSRSPCMPQLAWSWWPSPAHPGRGRTA